jgi:thiosulfate/3-mercaptopyruvate sulfurtransferase
MPASASLPPVVDPAVVRADPSAVVVCEVGSTMGGGDPGDAHRNGHLPGARFVSLEADLSAPAGPIVGRHPLPSPADFAAALGRLGIADTAAVVAYDRQTGGLAARFVWMLRVLGQPAALLDGGLAAWDGPLEVGDGPDVDPVEVPERPWPSDALADADDVAATIDAGGAVIDSRDAVRYSGEQEPIDPVAGHVPGAINVPFAGNLSGGRFRPVDELRTRFAPALERDGRPIVSCGSGVTACHNALAMELAGLERPRVYVGSWSGWSSDPARPVATGDAP